MTTRSFGAFACALLTTVVSAAPAWASFQPIPEPATMSVFGLGIGAAILINRRKKK